MWLIHMIYPEVNTVGGSKKGQTLAARGLVRIVEMHVGHARTEVEAKRMCVRLAVQTLKDRGHGSTVIGYGIRNYYAKKGEKLRWKLSVQQLVRVLETRRAKRAAMAEAAKKAAPVKKIKAKKAA